MTLKSFRLHLKLILDCLHLKMSLTPRWSHCAWTELLQLLVVQGTFQQTSAIRRLLWPLFLSKTRSRTIGISPQTLLCVFQPHLRCVQTSQVKSSQMKRLLQQHQAWIWNDNDNSSPQWELYLTLLFLIWFSPSSGDSWKEASELLLCGSQEYIARDLNVCVF